MTADGESRGICVKTAYKNRLFVRTDRCLTTMEPSRPQKRAVLRPSSQNCSMRAVFLILRLALGGEGRLGEVAGEQQSRQQEGGAQSGVAAHHGQGRGLAVFRGGDPLDIGDDIGPIPAELEEEVQLLLVGADAGCDRMLPVCEEKSRRSGSFRLHDDL